MYKILFIEDSGFDMSAYREVFRDDERYKIYAAFDVIQSKSLLKEGKISKYQLIILDIMMPTQGLFTLDETEGGMLTGIKLFEKYIHNKPTHNPVSVIILTNASGDTYNSIKSKAERYKHQIIDLLNKNEITPRKIKSITDKYLGNNYD